MGKLCKRGTIWLDGGVACEKRRVSQLRENPWERMLIKNRQECDDMLTPRAIPLTPVAIQAPAMEAESAPVAQVKPISFSRNTS
jgi:hypothetical protein